MFLLGARWGNQELSNIPLSEKTWTHPFIWKAWRIIDRPMHPPLHLPGLCIWRGFELTLKGADIEFAEFTFSQFSCLHFICCLFLKPLSMGGAKCRKRSQEQKKHEKNNQSERDLYLLNNRKRTQEVDRYMPRWVWVCGLRSLTPLGGRGTITGLKALALEVLSESQSFRISFSCLFS